MDTGINTIEFYSGDISGNFANAASPQASGGSQDNASTSVTFVGTPTGPVQWQVGIGGDGFYSRIDPVGTGSSLRFFQGNNSGGMSRCVSNCTAPRSFLESTCAAPGQAILSHSSCRTIFSTAVSQAAMIVPQPVFPEVAVI